MDLLKPTLPAHHVRVDFGAGIPGSVQGPALLLLERYLRETCGVPAQVFKQTLPDDLKRRRDMTDEQRATL
jgi:hypothetical protein